jgi:uncharacterized protein (DUF2147 family)
MSRSIVTAAAAAFAAATTLATGASAAESPEGVWMNDTGRGAIEIKSCGEGLCGHVVWVKEGADTYGCGKQIIGDVKSTGEGTWDGGWIYSPDKKRRFDVELEPQSDGTLKVTGYAGVKFLSRTMVWKPAPSSLERCNAEEAAAPSKPAAAAKTAAAPIKTAKAEPISEKADAPKPVAKAKPAKKSPPPTAEEEEVADADDNGSGKRFNLEDGIEVGDLFSLKKEGNGKCKIKAPYVDIIVDCDRN